MRSTRFWALLLAGTALCCGAAILVLRLTAAPAVTASIYQGGVLLEQIDLTAVEESYSFIVRSPDGGSNTVSVERGRICISQADCPDQVCVHQGGVSDGATPIVCLPHQLVIQIEGGEQNLDATT